MRASTLLALCLFAFGSIGLVSAASALKVGEPAPDFTLKALNGRTIDKNVKPATSAEDMAAKLHELGVPTRSQ
jgi:hypothetical protein